MKNNKPVIRFKGFSEEWEEKELGEIATMKARIGWQGLTQKEFLDSGDYYLITGTDFNNGSIDIKNCHYIGADRYNQDSNIQIKDNDVLITKDGTIGKVAFVKNLDKPATLNAGVFVVRGKNDDINNLYLYHHLASPLLLDFADKQATGGTIKHLNQNVLVRFPVPLPQTAEQTQIGNFFKNLDNLITLHQRKYEKLGTLKKAMLEKMFPKNGANVPEIRFKGFEGAWEEKTLSCIVSRVSCISNKVGLPRVEYEDIISGKGELNKDIEQKNSRKIGIEFEIGDVLYGKLRPYLNNWLLPTFKGIAVGDFWVFRPNEASSKFIFYLIQTSDYEKIANQSSGSKMPRADWNLISNAIFFIPLDKEEQEKIGTYFKNLDDLLKLHQGELAKLKNLKKALLEKMFV